MGIEKSFDFERPNESERQNEFEVYKEYVAPGIMAIDTSPVNGGEGPDIETEPDTNVSGTGD